MAKSSCLTNTQLTRILNGALTLNEASQAEDHLDQCTYCMSLLVDLVKVVPAHHSGSYSCPDVSQTDEMKLVLDE